MQFNTAADIETYNIWIEGKQLVSEFMSWSVANASRFDFFLDLTKWFVGHFVKHEIFNSSEFYIYI